MPKLINHACRRGLALGLLIAPILVMIVLVVIPLLRIYEDNQQRIETLQNRLIHYTAKNKSRDILREQAVRLETAIQNAAIYTSQSSVPLALADMQQRVRNAVTRAGAEISSTQNLPQQTLENLTKIGINIRFSGKIGALKTILQTIESAKPYMIVESMKVLSVKGERNLKTSLIEPIDKVHVSLDVISFIPGTS